MLKYFIRDAFDTMSMGNYPFASSYIAGTAETPMPPYPVSIACSYLSNATLASSSTRLHILRSDNLANRVVVGWWWFRAVHGKNMLQSGQWGWGRFSLVNTG